MALDPGQIAELRTLRGKAGLTQQRLAERADCSISWVRLVESGASCSPEMAERLLGALEGDRDP